MGVRIDRTLILGLLTSLFFLALRGFVPSVLACMALSFLFGAAAYRLFRRLENGPRRLKKRRLRRAEAYLDALPLQRGEEGALHDLLPEGTRLLVRLPDSALSREEVLALWRAADSPLILATTGTLPRQTVELARTLPAPEVTLIGRAELIRRLANAMDFPLPECARTPRGETLRVRLERMLQKNRLGMLGSCLYGGVLMGLYLLSGSGVYLICSLCLLVIGVLTLRVRRAGR